jgi:heat shock protein HtpX
MARMTYARGVQESLVFFLIARRLKRFALWLFAPLSQLELLRFSRAREFTADRIAAEVYGPQHMISVLEKLKTEQLKPKPTEYSTAMMWGRIIDQEWFRTHPPLEHRIAALKGVKRKSAVVQQNHGDSVQHDTPRKAV